MSDQEHHTSINKEFQSDINNLIERIQDVSGYRKGGYVSPVDKWRPSTEREIAVQKLKEAAMWFELDNLALTPSK